MSEATLEQQLILLRQISDTTGGLHELQIRQLKIWPMVCIKGCSSSKARVDTDNHLVEVQCIFQAPVTKKDQEQAKAVTEQIQWMLGPSWLVQVVENRLGTMTPIFTVERKREFDRAKYAGTDFAAGEIVPEKPWNWRKKREKLKG